MQSDLNHRLSGFIKDLERRTSGILAQKNMKSRQAHKRHPLLDRVNLRFRLILRVHVFVVFKSLILHSRVM